MARGERTRLRDARPDLPDAFVQIVERAVAADPQTEMGERRCVRGRARTISGRATRAARAEADLHKGVDRHSGGSCGAVCRRCHRLLARRSRSIDDSDTLGHLSSRPQPPAANVAGAYTIDAALYRERDGRERRLQTGLPVQPGDKLSLEIRVSTPAHVYVVNEDDHGESYLLFPLPGQKVTNPLPAGRPTRLPGDRRSTGR